MAAEYRRALPDEEELAAEIERTQALLEERKKIAIASGMAAPMKGAKTQRKSGGRKVTK